MEKYPSRREAMASEIEQGEKYQAMQTLLELGICKKVSDLELYHGRAGDGGRWQVDPSYDNAGNNTGRHNINKIPALNTGEYKIAKDFSEARVSYDGGSPEIHRIISNDPDAMIIASRLPNLTEQDKKKVFEAVVALSPSVMSGAPIAINKERHEFQHRNRLIEKISPEYFRNEYGLMFEDEIPGIEKKTGFDKELVTHIGSAINTQNLLARGMLVKLCNTFINSNDTTISVNTKDDGVKTIPFSREYLSNWLRSAHIVGIMSHGDWSATLGTNIDVCRFFDLEKINTEETIKRKVQNRNRFFGKIATTMNEKNKNNSSALLNELKSNLYIKPHEIIEIAKKTPGFKDVFEADAGNWEGFKLGEHTETVLRLFDDNYADILPASIIPIIRLALLVHDIGKPEAVKMRDKFHQKKYNVKYADKFMKLNSVDDATSELILSLIGEGLDLSSELIMDRGNVYTKWKISNYCEKIAKKYLTKEEVDQDTIIGFRHILEIIQTCDSAAYTTMAITRASNGIRYRNYGSFNSSFDNYKGFIGKRAKLKLD